MSAVKNPNLRPPGVYFQRSDVPRAAIEATRTDMAGFVGVAERGPLHEAIRVDSWHQFQSTFGNDYLPHAYMPDSVRGFFANGGQTAWIVRVGRLDRIPQLPAARLVNDRGEPVLRVRAKHQGLAGARLSLRVTPQRDSLFHLTVLLDDQELESFRNLTATRPRHADEQSGWVISVINDQAKSVQINDQIKNVQVRPANLSQQNRGSQLIQVEEISGDPLRSVRIVGLLSSGGHTVAQTSLAWDPIDQSDARRSELTQMSWQDFVGDDADESPRGLRVLNTIDQPSVIAIPDAVWRPDETPVKHIIKQAGCARVRLDKLEDAAVVRRAFTESEILKIQQQMLLHCAQLKDRFAVIDSPKSKSPAEVLAWSEQLRSQEGQYGGLYYPWIACPSRSSTVRWLPSSGHVCGLYARVDLDRGVHTSPANEVVQEARGVQRVLDGDDHARLNQQHVNVIVATANRGIRVMGARTLVDPENAYLWRNIAVRRLLMMLEESIEEQSHWLVHQSNTLTARMDLERVMRQFLFEQWRLGRLDGESPEAAFHVVCDETNNPPEIRETARLICDITVRPPAPSEFVTVRIGGQSSSASWRLGGEDA